MHSIVADGGFSLLAANDDLPLLAIKATLEIRLDVNWKMFKWPIECDQFRRPAESDSLFKTGTLEI